MHPLELEMDEAQDYPDAGWVELGETLRFARPGAKWRSHGVSRGVQDRYFKQTQPGSGWKVHRFTGMHRPDWTPQEREAKAELYGSRNDPDYRRNVLGLHGDAVSPMFVLPRLMQCVDDNKDSYYNTVEYCHIRLSDEKVRDSGLPIKELLEFPAGHQAYSRTWAGMDVGITNHPSEILIFGEDIKTGNAKPDTQGVPDARLKLLCRVHLERISTPDQRAVMEAIWDYYRPKLFAMDGTGVGLPIYHEILEGNNPNFASSVRSYNFTAKIVVGYRPPDEDDDYLGSTNAGEPLEAIVLEYASDMLRLRVDRQQLLLPWDLDLVREFQGQTWTTIKSTTNAYGRRTYSKGKFHALDAARMAILAAQQETIEHLTEIAVGEPIFDRFL